jgi:hypothetical protein
MRDQELIGLYEAYKEVHRPTETTEELEYDTQSSYQDWVNQLVEEGYDLSNWTDEGLYELYYNEAYKGGPEFGMKYSKSKPLSGEKGDGSGYGGPEKFKNPDDNIEKPGTTVPPFKKGGYGRIMSNIPHGIGAHRDKIASKITTTTGGDPGAPTSQKMRSSEKKKPSREIIRKKQINADFEMWVDGLLNEGYDLSNWTSMGLYEYYEQLCEESVEIGQSPTPGGITPKRTPSSTVINRTPKERKLTPIESYKESYDIIFDYLLDEGYADTEDSALVIMANMSEEWRESICEELTGPRKKRALEIGGPVANRIVRGNEGQPLETKSGGLVIMRTTKKGPTNRGGGGVKGRPKSDWYGNDETHGSENKSRRRRGMEVIDTSLDEE